ncbi:hypothetical protein EGH23_13625 [Halomicroarcula sp. F27]|uniref:Uncharacterized protein n=2 Tax=Haloarcula nitratireducens TaxID=2487749 RepID=A0AAW4PE72_9EURY|nr:hypothetical protein [Halomicroarcula nitratireducens]
MGDQYPAVTRREMVALVAGASLAGCTGLTRTGQEATPRQPTAQGTTRDGRQTEGDQQTDDGQTVRAFVGSYHWGYFVLDTEGTERDQVTLSPGDELRVTAFNVESDDAVAALPRAVRDGIPSSAERARRNERAVPEPSGASLETLHEAAESAYPDHSLAIVSDEYLRPGGRGGGQGGPGRGGQGQGTGPGPGQGPWGGHHGPHGGPYGPGSGQSQGPMGPGRQGGCWSPGFAGTLAPPTYLWHHSTVPAEMGFVVETTGSFGFACTVYCGYGHPYMAEAGRLVVSDE